MVLALGSVNSSLLSLLVSLAWAKKSSPVLILLWAMPVLKKERFKPAWLMGSNIGQYLNRYIEIENNLRIAFFPLIALSLLPPLAQPALHLGFWLSSA